MMSKSYDLGDRRNVYLEVAWACILEVVEVVAVSSVEPACKRASLVEVGGALEAVACTGEN